MTDLTPIQLVAKDAADRASINTSFDETKRTPPQLLFAPILFAIEDAIKAGTLTRPSPTGGEAAWREAYRSMDASGAPDAAKDVGRAWLNEVALAEKATDPAGLYIHAPQCGGYEHASVLYRGTKLRAAAFTFRDDMNFAILIRWMAPDALPHPEPIRGEAAGLEAAAKYHDAKAARWTKEARRHQRPSGNSPCMDRDLDRAAQHRRFADDLRYMASSRLLAALPAEPVKHRGGGDREAIAAIIDPTAWKTDSDGYSVEQSHSNDALAKADAILSLPSLMEGGESGET